VITFGCRVNQADSLTLEDQLLHAGARPADPDHADIVIVNTCSVTAAADQGARQTVRRIARTNPDARIVVTGCYATRRPDEVADLPNVVHVVPNARKPELLDVALPAAVPRVAPDDAGVSGGTAKPGRDAQEERAAGPIEGGEHGSRGDGARSARVAPAVSDEPAGIAPGFGGRTAFTLRVQTGCAEPCTYCIIPTTRGEPRSMPVDAVANEVLRAAAANFREIVLTGVHLGSYGRDLSPAASLEGLLEALAGLSRSRPAAGSVLFRISSLEPMDCTAAIVRLVARESCFAPHFHLPLQHASSRVLAAMRRPYTIEAYARLVAGIRACMPDAALGSDVIAGFPGETDAEFDELVRFLENAPLTHLHVFPYSDRPGTPAARADGKVNGAVVRERARVLRDLSARLTLRFHLAQIGRTHRALTIDDGSLAVTGNYLKVRLDRRVPRNSWITVRVTGARPLAGVAVSGGPGVTG
jgi:threonylcarbamoyladenosine tRNA methylthiotransferase MtaB